MARHEWHWRICVGDDIRESDAAISRIVDRAASSAVGADAVGRGRGRDEDLADSAAHQVDVKLYGVIDIFVPKMGRSRLADGAPSWITF